MTHWLANLAASELTITQNGSTTILTPAADDSRANRIEYAGGSHAEVWLDGDCAHTVLVRGVADPEPTADTIRHAVREHVELAAIETRRTRLREIARTHSASTSYDVEELLHDTPKDGDIKCPRFVAIAEHAEERTLFCDDSLAELVATLTEIAVAEIQERPEEIIDLDTETHYKATGNLVITFDPPLPGSEQHRMVRFVGGERSALRLLCEIAEEHAGENEHAREAVAIADELLDRAYPTAAGTGVEKQ